MYSQTRFNASVRSISLPPPVSKNLASASEIITEEETVSVVSGAAGSTSTFALLAWLAPSAHHKWIYVKSSIKDMQLQE